MVDFPDHFLFFFFLKYANMIRISNISFLRFCWKNGKLDWSKCARTLHGSGIAAIQMSCFCRAKKKFINYINVFWRDCVPMGSWKKNCHEASVNPEFGSTLARRLNQSCFPAVLQSNQITIKFGTAEA